MSAETLSERLKDRVALVVGGGQVPGQTVGNGRATALTFAREGAKVAVVDRDLASAEETVDMIREQYGTDVIALQGDITNDNDHARFVGEAMTRFGRIDILHNNVGIGSGDGGPRGITLDAWRHIMEVNLTGMLGTIKAVLPIMQEQKSGSIINISSNVSIVSDTHVYARDSVGLPFDESGYIAYRVSKTGVNSMTESLASSQAPFCIRVNAILPGLMETPMGVEGSMDLRDRTRDDISALRDEQVPLGNKQGTAWDVANAALFLASDESRFVTGVLLPVDGGQNLRRG